MKFFKPCALFIFLKFFFNPDAIAQQTSAEPDSTGPFYLNNIDTWVIHSNTIGEDYKLYVLRTVLYDTTNIKLPVLYMTDGDWNMTVAMNCFSMLRQDYDTREPLIVGIGYGKGTNKRFRDLNPQTGGPAFLTFIEKEVMPFIERKYRTATEKAIYGYSMGGLFTTYILFNRPELFDMVFIGAPGNSGRQLMADAKKYFADHHDLKSKVFIGVGSYEGETAKNIDSFTTYLLAQKSPGLNIRSVITPDANHGAALAQVMQNAIKFGYCKQHIAAAVPAATYSSLTGTYSDDGKSNPDALIFIKNNRLFIRWNEPGSVAVVMIPQSTSEYFIMEDERLTFVFKKVDNKSKLIIQQGKSEYPFTKR